MDRLNVRYLIKDNQLQANYSAVWEWLSMILTFEIAESDITL